MADPFEPIRQALAAAPAVTAIVATRITPLVKPQAGANPSISLQLPEHEPENNLRGSSNLDHARVQVEYWASEYDVADDLATKGRAAIDAADPTLLCIGTLRDYDFEVKLYRFTQDYSVWV